MNWWCLKFGTSEVVNLVMRHFEHGEVYKSCLYLAETCGLPKPGNHNNTSTRPALEPCANDLVKIVRSLIDSKQLPSIVIPAAELGRVPLEALSVSDERSVSARLESLEESVKTVVSAVEKLATVRIPVPSLATIPVVSITPAWGSNGVGQTFADIASRQLQHGPGQQGVASAQVRHPLGPLRQRSRSPQVKRDHVGEEVVADETGFRRQGRPRHQNRPAAAGASKVVVDDVGDLQPSLQYYIGNTPGKANGDIIKKVLERCAVPIMQDKGRLVIESIHCLTKDPDPRTRCWRVVVSHRFKDVMENNLLYPEGWKYREFVGIFRNISSTTKKIKMNDNTIVDQVMADSGQTIQGRDQQLHSLQQQVMQLMQVQGNSGQQAVGQVVAGHGQPAQAAQ